MQVRLKPEERRKKIKSTYQFKEIQIKLKGRKKRTEKSMARVCYAFKF